MNYTLKIGTTDVSDYIIDIDSVPVVSRNPDYSLVAEGYSFVISQNYSGVSSVALDDRVYFYRSGSLLHNGYISKILYDSEDKSYKIDVEHIFVKLQDILFDYDAMSSRIGVNDSVQLINGTTTVYAMITHNNLIKSIIESIPVSPIITTNLTYFVDYDISWKTKWAYWTSKATLDTTAVAHTKYIDEKISNIWYLRDQLYCINQDLAYARYRIDEDTDLSDKKISAWDMLSFLSTITGYTYFPKDENEFYILNSESFISGLSNNFKFEVQEEDFPNKEDNVKLVYVATGGDGGTGQGAGGIEYWYWVHGGPNVTACWFFPQEQDLSTYGWFRRFDPDDGSGGVYRSSMPNLYVDDSYDNFYWPSITGEYWAQQCEFSSYIGADRDDAKELLWYNHFNLFLMPSGDPDAEIFYVFPEISLMSTLRPPLEKQINSIIYPYTEYYWLSYGEVVFSSPNYWALGTFTNFSIDDVKKDTIELKWIEYEI